MPMKSPEPSTCCLADDLLSTVVKKVKQYSKNPQSEYLKLSTIQNYLIDSLSSQVTSFLSATNCKIAIKMQARLKYCVILDCLSLIYISEFYVSTWVS